MKELTDLIVALTRLAYEAEQWFIRQGGVSGKKLEKALDPTPKKAAEKAEDALADLGLGDGGEKQEKRKELTEKESEAEVLKVTQAFVNRFAKDKPSGHERAKDILTKKFGGKGIKKLDHAERLKLIALLSAEIEKSK